MLLPSAGACAVLEEETKSSMASWSLIRRVLSTYSKLQTEFPPIDFAFAWRQNKQVKKQNNMFY